MKKFIFVLALVTSMAVFTACKDDDDSKTCSCKEYDLYTNEYIGSSEIDPSSFNASNCHDLANHLNQFAIDTYISCL